MKSTSLEQPTLSSRSFTPNRKKLFQLQWRAQEMSSLHKFKKQTYSKNSTYLLPGWRFRQKFSGLPADCRSETNISWLCRPNPDPTPISESPRFSENPRISEHPDFSKIPGFPNSPTRRFFRDARNPRIFRF